MKNLKIALAFFSLLAMASTCKKNPLNDPATGSVKLIAILNDTSEVLHLGDTLKLLLTLPDTLQIISKADGSISPVVVSSLQGCNYLFTFYSIDTITTQATRITDNSHVFATIGRLDNVYGVYTTNASPPYASLLNLVPTQKGLYYVQFGTQETLLTANGVFNAGVRVNVNAINKHWAMYAGYFDPSYSTDFFNTVNDLNNQGYGFYCFKVE